MKKAFENKLRLNNDNKYKLQVINDIIEDYSSQGYKMTLRQLYYRLVTKKVISNEVREYQKLSTLLTKGRLAGVVDWNAIEDRVRRPKNHFSVDDPTDAIDYALRLYRLDKNKDQNEYIEVWVEKDALSGVLNRITDKYSINLMVNRGYSSITAMYDSYLRFKDMLNEGKNINIIYLGDHDPSGLDMIRDIKNRLLTFLGCIQDLDQEETEAFIDSERYKELVDQLGNNKNYIIKSHNKKYYHVGKFLYYDKLNIIPLALTMNQIKENDLPPDPAKVSDPRAKDYIRKFGHSSWELDALEPRYLNNLLENQIRSMIDLDVYENAVYQERQDKAELKSIIDNLNM